MNSNNADIDHKGPAPEVPVTAGRQVRNHMLLLRLNDEEVRRVKRLAEHFGLGKQDALRMIAKSECDAIEASRRGSI